MRRLTPLLGMVLVVTLLQATSAGAAPSAGAMSSALASSGEDTRPNVPRSSGFEVVGYNSLLNRGMNAAIAIHGDYAYVGSRTDGTHPNAGVLILDISDPTNPVVVNQIVQPDEANPAATSRELRVWPEQDLLMVLNFQCSSVIHACAAKPEVKPNIKFYDIRGDLATEPKLMHTYKPKREPHEFYLWDDPDTAGRALVYMSTPAEDDDNILVADISDVREGKVTEVVSTLRIPGEALHSLSVNVKGTRAYLAYLEKGFLVADTSDLAKGVADPRIKLVTPPDQAADWQGPGAHSAVPLFGSDNVLVTDEVYGKFGGLLSDHGCPWGWTRLVDAGNARQPAVISDYKLSTFNHRSYCDEVPYQRDNFASFSAHNPTLTQNVAFITWHSGGLQAIDISHPQRPTQAGEFVPKPVPFVFTEDPALSSGIDKVVMWSYPIIKDGLIYVVDVRNGLYVLDYTGDFSEEVSRIDFLEGNSNLGDAPRLAGGGASGTQTPVGGVDAGGGGTATLQHSGLLAGSFLGLTVTRIMRESLARGATGP